LWGGGGGRKCGDSIRVGPELQKKPLSEQKATTAVKGRAKDSVRFPTRRREARGKDKDSGRLLLGSARVRDAEAAARGRKSKKARGSVARKRLA